MELGNICFGHSRGEFEFPRDSFWQENTEWESLLEKLGMDFYPTEFDNSIFTIRGYCWGDCSCGYEDKEYKWSDENKHSESCYQNYVRKLKLENGWEEEGDFLGTPKFFYKNTDWRKLEDAIYKNACKKFNIPYNKGYGSAVHCTCNHQSNWIKFCEENNHKEDCIIILPNFLYKPTGFEIRFYKYPFRDSYMNQDLSVEEIKNIFKECIKSI